MQEDCEPHDEEDHPAGWPGMSDMIGGHEGAFGGPEEPE